MSNKFHLLRRERLPRHGVEKLISISGYDTSSRAMDANGNTTAFQANGWSY